MSSLADRLKLHLARRRVAAAFRCRPWEREYGEHSRFISDGMCPDEITLRISSYLRQHPWASTDLKKHLLPASICHKPGTPEHLQVLKERILWFETSTPILEALIQEGYGPAQSDGISDYRKLGMIDSTYDGLRAEQRASLTNEQHRTVLKVTLLLPGHFPSDQWFFQQIMDRPTELDLIVAEWKRQRHRYQWIVEEMLGGVHDYAVHYSDELIHRLADARHTHPYLFRDIAGLIDVEATEAEVSDKLYFLQQTGLDLVDADEAINGLHYYTELPRYTAYSEAPEEVRYQCIALIKTAVALTHVNTHPDPPSSKGTWKQVIADKRIIDLLLEHPERADMIATAIYERKTNDFTMIQTATSSVISHGVL